MLDFAKQAQDEHASGQADAMQTSSPAERLESERLESGRLGKGITQRLEAKLRAMEAQQLRADRRVAELSGLVQGLSEEQRAQLHRLDRVDERLRGGGNVAVEDEWRQRLGEA